MAVLNEIIVDPEHIPDLEWGVRSLTDARRLLSEPISDIPCLIDLLNLLLWRQPVLLGESFAAGGRIYVNQLWPAMGKFHGLNESDFRALCQDVADLNKGRKSGFFAKL